MIVRYISILKGIEIDTFLRLVCKIKWGKSKQQVVLLQYLTPQQFCVCWSEIAR